MHSMHMQTQLFDVLVSPILTYGSEVWGPALLHGATSPDTMLNKGGGAQQLQATFLRAVAGGVRASTSRLLLLREFGWRPLSRSG